jgi:hypothetical protein
MEMSKEEALSLLQHAAALQAPEFAILCYANDRIAFTQALYRARKGDPMLEAIQIRQTRAGVALLNPTFNEGEWSSPFVLDQSHQSQGDDDDAKIC